MQCRTTRWLAVLFVLVACDSGGDDGEDTAAGGTTEGATAATTPVDDGQSPDDGADGGPDDGGTDDGTTDPADTGETGADTSGDDSSGGDSTSAGSEANPCGDIALEPFEPFTIDFGGDAIPFEYAGSAASCIINGSGGFFGQWLGGTAIFEITVAPGPGRVGMPQSERGTKTFQISYEDNNDFEFRSLTGTMTYVSQTESNHPDTLCLFDIETMEGLGESAEQTATVPGPIALACPAPGQAPP